MLLLWILGCTEEKNSCLVETDTLSTPAFVEKTDEWGLGEIMAEGYRISAVDYDGDGWTDLFIRIGSEPDDFSGTRSSWLLRNEGG